MWKRPPHIFSAETYSQGLKRQRKSRTIKSQVVVEDLEEGEGLPRVGRLLTQDGVHVNGEQRPEDLAVLHQQV